MICVPQGRSEKCIISFKFLLSCTISKFLYRLQRGCLVRGLHSHGGEWEGIISVRTKVKKKGKRKERKREEKIPLRKVTESKRIYQNQTGESGS